jgi:hypothetical protein
MMVHRFLLLLTVALSLSGCTAQPEPSPSGYLYYDANHPNAVTGASAQATYNVTHGTWLWPSWIGGGGSTGN